MTPGADVGQPCKAIEQTLNGTIFPKRAVQHGEDYVHAQRIRPRITGGDERGDTGVGREHHALARAQHFAECRFALCVFG